MRARKRLPLGSPLNRWCTCLASWRRILIPVHDPWTDTQIVLQSRNDATQGRRGGDGCYPSHTSFMTWRLNSIPSYWRGFTSEMGHIQGEHEGVSQTLQGQARGSIV
jgi:hypothetical protein